MVHEYYIILTTIGLVYMLFAAITEYDFMIGRISLGLPYGITGWGLVGLAEPNEPIPFLIGFLIPFASISLLYIYITSSGNKYERFILQDAVVTIPPSTDTKGEIKVSYNKSNEFLVALAKDGLKPIPKGTTVTIIDFQDSIAIVQHDSSKFRPKNVRSQLYNKIFGIIKFLAPKPKISGTCLICYGGLIRNKNGVKCPVCKHVAHLDHMKAWLANNEQCPNCRTLLSLVSNKLVKIS